jgi:hypothetical protein
MPNAKKARGDSKKDLHEVSDNPALTKSDFARARPFSKVFPDLSASLEKGEPQQVSDEEALKCEVTPLRGASGSREMRAIRGAHWIASLRSQ